MATSNGGSLAALGGSEATGNGTASGVDGTGTDGSGGDGGDANADHEDHSDDGGDAGSDDSDSMDFDDEEDDDDGSDLISNATLGDDITAQLAAAGKLSGSVTYF